VALWSPRDAFHTKALALYLDLEKSNTSVVTTRAVLLEIGNSLSGLHTRSAAIDLLNSLESDPRIGIVSATDELYVRAFNLYQSRQDKEWGLVDCMSFIVMWDREINAALTSDLHFRQAGFNVLLRE